MEASVFPLSSEPVAAPPAPERRIERFKFTASGGEYFRIWIVNLLLTICTLGIYSAWAKVRRLRYFYGSTQLAGSAFEYHGQPLQILKGRLIAVVVFAIYSALTAIWPLSAFVLVPLLIFTVPWMIVRSRMFHMRMSSWRGLRFGFHGEYRGALAAYVGWGVVAIVTLYIMLPFWLYKQVKYQLGNTSYGSQRFAFEKPSGLYFRFYYKTLAMALCLMFGLIVLAALGAGILAAFKSSQPQEAMIASGAGLLMMVGIVVTMLLAAAYYERSFNNANFNDLGVGPHRLRCELKARKLLLLYVTNILGILFTLGLFYPWALIRRIRYQLESMSVDTAGSLDAFTAAAGTQTSAVGEAMGEFFNVDFGL